MLRELFDDKPSCKANSLTGTNEKQTAYTHIKYIILFIYVIYGVIHFNGIIKFNIKKKYHFLKKRILHYIRVLY